MTEKIPVSDLERAAREFALPQIEIIEPDIAVCLGKDCFDALRVAARHAVVPNDPIGYHFVSGLTRFGAKPIQAIGERSIEAPIKLEKIGRLWPRPTSRASAIAGNSEKAA